MVSLTSFPCITLILLKILKYKNATNDKKENILLLKNIIPNVSKIKNIDHILNNYKYIHTNGLIIINY